MAAGFLAWFVGRKGKNGAAKYISLITVVLEYVFTFMLMRYIGEEVTIPAVFTVDLHFQVTAFQLTLVGIACFAWLMSTLMCLKTDYQARFRMFSLMSLGMTFGAFLASDFVTLVVFFVIMSIVNWFVVLHNGDEKAYNAGNSYIGSAIISTMLTMMGMFMMHHIGESLSFKTIAEVIPEVEKNATFYTAGILITIGYLTNAAVFPFHTWQSKTYGAAPAVGSAFMSSAVSKVGVFAVCVVSTVIFAGDATFGMILLVLACLTMLAGGVFAIFASNMKRMIANVAMAQSGMIFLGVALSVIFGDDGATAAKGAVMQTVSAALSVLCLYLCAAAVECKCGCTCLNSVKGAGKGKTALMVAFIVAALGVVGIPVFGGFAGISALYVSAGAYLWAQYALVVSLGLVLLALAKLFTVLFLDKTGEESGKLCTLSNAVLIVSAAGIVYAGLTVGKLADVCLPFFGFESAEYEVSYMFIIKEIAIAAVCYCLFGRMLHKKEGKYVNAWPEGLDLEEKFYRPLFMTVLPYIGGFCARLAGSVFDWIVSGCDMIIKRGNENIAAKNEDDKFAVYPKDMETSRGTASTLAYGLALAGMVLVATFAWVLLRL